MMERARVLVVEDSEILRATLTISLEQLGLAVTATGSGIAGLMHAARHRYAVVLLDIETDDLSGLAVQRAVSDFSAVPVVVMSARLDDWRAAALRAGAAACLPKPYRLADACALVQALAGTLPNPTLVPSDVRRLEAADLDRLDAMSRAELDALPFGAIKLDEAGRIIAFNAYEGAAAGLHPDQVLGRRFVDIAPCTNVRAFVERLAQGKAQGQLDAVLRFCFPRFSATGVVNVRLYSDRWTDGVWLFVSMWEPGRTDGQRTAVDRCDPAGL